MNATDKKIVRQNPYNQIKANIDCTRCLVCNQRFESDADRENVYREQEFIGVQHTVCFVSVTVAVN